MATVPFECEIDPKLACMDDLLADPKVLLAVTNDLARSAPEALWNGRPATPVEVTLRIAVVRRLMNWSLREAESEIGGSARWCWWCRLYGQPMPDHSTLQARKALIRPSALRRINAQVVRLAQARGVTGGTQLRSNSTVIETNIHYPTDSRLLDDSVRVLGRTLARARRLLRPSATAADLFRNRHRRAHRLARQIAHRLRGKNGAKKPAQQAQRLYRQLVQVSELSVAQAEAVQARLQRRKSQRAQRLAANLQHYLPLVQRVARQTRRRVLDGQSLPAAKKLVSLFEPHTAIIRRGKRPPKDTEFGRKVWYSEVDGGLTTAPTARCGVSEYRLLKGNPKDDQPWSQSLTFHQQLFGHPPQVATADRGVYSAANEHADEKASIEFVALPQPGHKDAACQAHEAQPWFKAALRFRTGIEGRISGLRRARGLDRCRNHGQPGLERWLGWGIFTNNLVVTATRLTRRRKCRPVHA